LTAQIFSPPYLFKGPRPAIASVTGPVQFGQPFKVRVGVGADVKQATWVRLSSVTHSFNFNQRINFLAFTRAGDDLTVTAPASANVCPPGHYMLFVISQAGVPSVAKIVQIPS